MHNYILGYNPFAANFTITQLYAFIKDNKHISQYYTPFAGTYVLKTTADLYTLQQTFQGFFEKSNFIVVQIYPHLTGGYLPVEAWNWYNANQFPALGPTVK